MKTLSPAPLDALTLTHSSACVTLIESPGGFAPSGCDPAARPLRETAQGAFSPHTPGRQELSEPAAGPAVPAPPRPTEETLAPHAPTHRTPEHRKTPGTSADRWDVRRARTLLAKHTGLNELGVEVGRSYADRQAAVEALAPRYGLPMPLALSDEERRP